MHHNIIVNEKNKGERLDKFIAGSLPDISRSRIQSLIESGNVSKNGQIIDNCSLKVKINEEFIITIPEAQSSQMLPNNSITLDIAYEDDDFMVINKQAGLTVHPGAGNYNSTLANALMAHCGDSLSGIGGVSRPGIVHRLDKDTSGLMVVAKNDKAHHGLSEQIAKRTMKRTYLAICWGVPNPHSATIESQIGRSSRNRLKMAIVPSGGKNAITHYTVKEILSDGIASIVECRLQTGRTHQIRVHMTEEGHPLIGDPLYGSQSKKKLKDLTTEAKEFLNNFNRQALHSYRLSLTHPITGAAMDFEKNMPEDMQTLVELLK